MAEEEKNPEKSSGLKYKIALFNILTWPLVYLPRRFLLALGAAGGRLAFHLWAKRRRVAVGNIELVKLAGELPPETDARALARESFANMGRTFLEALVCYHQGLKPFWEYCRVEEGGEYVEQALADARSRGRGVFFVTGHMGNWEVMCSFFARRFNFSLGLVGRNTGKPLVDSVIEKLRTQEGNAYIAKRGGAMEMMRRLKKGEHLGTLIDQAVVGNHPGAPIPFLGREASTNLGHLRMARRAQSPVVLMTFRREGLYHYIKVFPILEISNLKDNEEALMAEATQLNDWLGEQIKKYPDQWMWGHRRWKTKEGLRRDPESIV